MSTTPSRRFNVDGAAGGVVTWADADADAVVATEGVATAMARAKSRFAEPAAAPATLEEAWPVAATLAAAPPPEAAVFANVDAGWCEARERVAASL